MAYKLSRGAEDDLLQIYQTGVENFGVDQAESYQDGLEQAFDFLAEYPLAAHERPELNRASRAQPFRSHIIFYRLDSSDIFIQRIRHGREDWINKSD